MRGKFYGVGVGPGDPSLITVKAVEILKDCGCLIVPKSGGSADSTAYAIAKGYIKEDCLVEEIAFAMSREKNTRRESRFLAAEKVMRILEGGMDAVFVTLGDPTVYSTCMYLYEILEKWGYACELVPGVTSFCAAAARLGVSLCEEDESLCIVPVSRDAEKMREALDSFENVVLMKVSQNMDSIRDVLRDGKKDTFLVTRCGMEGETVIRNIEDTEGKDFSYFTTMVVKEKR